MVLPSSSWCVKENEWNDAGFLLEALRWREISRGCGGDTVRNCFRRCTTVYGGGNVGVVLFTLLWWKTFLKKRDYESAECKKWFFFFLFLFFKCLKFVLYIYIYILNFRERYFKAMFGSWPNEQKYFFYFMDLNWPRGLFLWLETFSITCQNIYTWYYYFLN